MENLDMKQTELAEKVGISKQSLYKYLHCQCEPRAEIIARMAITLHTSADFIVGLTNDSSPIVRDASAEELAGEEHAFFSKYKKLSKEDKIRIEERINMLLE
ncbi:MAG: helix-turn-helix transcriptional regulator [Clostridia bacterium]|nr:helix-turn-helix transcriptional regulator [Clostridia bacterium]